MLGQRHSVSLQLNARELQQLSFGPGVVLPDASADTRQFGGVFSFTRRLTPLLSADLTVTAFRIEGLGSRSSERTTEGEVMLSLIEQLSPRTTLTGALRYERLHSNAVDVVSGDATSLSVGLSHRF
jgi:uncharacterized protein (PEP-CTERM system associated)